MEHIIQISVSVDDGRIAALAEQAAEVFGAWQDTHLPEDRRREKVLAECTDVIQATLNLVAALGVEDFRPYLKACERRNRERGRISDGVE